MMVNNIPRLLCLLLILAWASGSFRINAQPKPKRDVSKDRSVLVAKQPKNAKKKDRKIVVPQRVSQNSNVSIINNESKRATFLKVNQLTAIDKSLNSSGGYESFNIYTDGDNWIVDSLPSWCQIYRENNSFAITYDANPSYDERTDCFLVSSDDQVVRINLKQDGAPMFVWACFHYGQLRHNVQYSVYGYSEKCLNICANITITGGMGQKFIIEAFILDEKNSCIKASYDYSKFAMNSSKNVFATAEVIPKTDNFNADTNIYLPNKAMRLLKKNNKLQCQLAVYCVKTSSYVSGANHTLNFKAKNKKGVITTKDY